MRNPPLSRISAVQASLFSSKSRKMLSSCRMSSSMSWGRVAMSCVLRCALADILVEQQARDHVERLEHAFTLVRDGFKGRDLHLAIVEEVIHVFDRRGV